MVWPVTGNPTWVDYEVGGTLVYAVHLNALEQAIENAHLQPYEELTGTAYTILATDGSSLKGCTSASAVTVTVPANTVTVPVGKVVRVDFLALGGAAITFVAGSGMTLTGTPSLVTRDTPSAATVIFLSATTGVVVGDLATP